MNYSLLLLVFSLSWSIVPTLVQAQVNEDNSLATDVTTDNNRDFMVDGGRQRGNNLFHSFTEFSIPNNGSVFFNNEVTIQNILTRVTGRSVSNIDGSIRANGVANLFLINPNGIIFGDNARLNIGGSFLATTAESIVFADGTEFSTENNSTPLLTVSVPFGLQFGRNPGSITNQAKFLIPNPLDPTGQDQVNLGLITAPNQTLALLGGNLIFDGGGVTTLGGNIELGSVGKNSFVVLESLAEGWQANYDNVSQFRDIQLDNLAIVDGTGEGSGDINLRGRNIQILGGSAITANTLGDIDGGKVSIEASQLLEINGSDTTGTKIDPLLVQFDLFYPRASQISSNTFGKGKAGDIEIIAQNLQVLNGGAIEIQTLPGSTGTGGDLSIRVFDSLNLQGIRPILAVGATARDRIDLRIPLDLAIEFNQSSEISTASISSGDSGSINIVTGNLSLRDGATIAASPFSSGNGGNINIDAQKTIAILGASPRTGSSSSSITANTFSSASAGDLNIKAEVLSIQDGGLLISSTNFPGDAGKINIDTSVVEISGFRSKDQTPSSISAQTLNGGNGGNITLNTELLSISDRALLSVQGSGRSVPGNLSVNANLIDLNQGNIIATTEFQSGGNIALNIQNNLNLRDNSTISAQAFGNANGGNLDITVNFLIVNPNENNDILATAFRGDGGKINIQGQGIFGIEERLSRPPNQTNDIDASSEFGSDGTVALEFADFAEFRTLAASFKTFVNLSDLFGGGFCDRFNGDRYSVLGKGGIALMPEDNLSLEDSWSDWRFFEASDGEMVNNHQSTPDIIGKSQLEMIQGWGKDRQGRVVLTVNPTVVTPHSRGLPSPDCGSNE